MEKLFEFLKTEEPRKTNIRLLLLGLAQFLLGFGGAGFIFIVLTEFSFIFGIPKIMFPFLAVCGIMTAFGTLAYCDLIGRKDSWILNKVLTWSASAKTSS
jgi:TM2 domain-containing membrane protein YozV